MLLTAKLTLNNLLTEANKTNYEKTAGQLTI